MPRNDDKPARSRDNDRALQTMEEHMAGDVPELFPEDPSLDAFMYDSAGVSTNRNGWAVALRWAASNPDAAHALADALASGS